jgi:hypothetical protein
MNHIGPCRCVDWRRGDPAPVTGPRSGRLQNLLKIRLMTVFAQMLITVVAFACLGTGALAGGTTIVPTETWNNVFAGGERTFRYVVTSDRAVDRRVTWLLSRDSRVLARGEVAVQAQAGEAHTVEFRVTLPEVKEGVIFPCYLTVALVSKDAGPEVPLSGRTLYLFPKDSFADRKQWLKDLGIRLFDPEKKTAECFAKADIPFTEIRTTDALAAVRDGLVVVGEGVSLKEERGLASAMSQAVEAGVPVLCLALRGGEMPLPTESVSETQGKAPIRMTFRRADIITELDKRLDMKTWAPGRNAVASSLVLSADRRVAAVEAVGGDRGWAWMDVAFQGGGRLVVCGFAIVSGWEDSPTPRFLLLRVLEEMGKKSKTGE